ncbi:unnamed protein product [Acidithrix sp. C25]|nr:unnamed protein product [Acidithrix sp. C25]
MLISASSKGLPRLDPLTEIAKLRASSRIPMIFDGPYSCDVLLSATSLFYPMWRSG